VKATVLGAKNVALGHSAKKPSVTFITDVNKCKNLQCSDTNLPLRTANFLKSGLHQAPLINKFVAIKRVILKIKKGLAHLSLEL
jgi:hypothetical protein